MKRILILQVLLCTGFASGAIEPNLIGWWKLDERTGSIINDSADSHNGNVYGANWVEGQIGGALSFDGINDYAALPQNSPVWLPQNDFTLCSWVYFYKDPIGSQHNFILDLDFQYWANHSNCSGVAFFRSTNDGRVVLQIETTNKTESLGSNEVLAKNRWYHIAGVRRGTILEIYIDGQLNATVGCSADPIKYYGSCRTYNVLVGKYDDGCWTSGTYYLNGAIDDIRIYSRALSSDEILKIYEGNLIGIEITGPDEVAENTTASYRAIAEYENGTTKDVTTQAQWSIEPNKPASIDKGLLTTGEALYPQQDVIIFAEVTDNNVTHQAEKEVSILAICPQGNALKFDGSDDYVQVPDDPNNQITTNQITVSAWIKLARDVGPTQKRIICKQQSNTIGWGFEIFGNGYVGATGNQVTFHIHNPAGTSNYISPKCLKTNRWYHIVATDNAGEIRIYIDGQLDKSWSVGYSIPSMINAPIIIGRHNQDATFFFDGVIDEVSVFDRALTVDEIKNLMFTKLTGSEANLIAYWDFDEGTGQAVTDISGRGNNGTIGNSDVNDEADPCWVESDAPFSLCTTEQMVVRNLGRAVNNKEIANDLLCDAKAKELASVNMIDDIKKGLKGREAIDAIKAKTQINIAILQENLVSRQIDTTIDRLEYALWLLSDETDPNRKPSFWFVGPEWNNKPPACLYGPRK